MRFPLAALVGIASIATFACTQSSADPKSGPAPSGSAQTAAAPGALAELGKPAPDFSLPDLEGKMVKLSDLKGKTVVIEWSNPDCPFVKRNHTEGPLRDMA